MMNTRSMIYIHGLTAESMETIIDADGDAVVWLGQGIGSGGKASLFFETPDELRKFLAQATEALREHDAKTEAVA